MTEGRVKEKTDKLKAYQKTDKYKAYQKAYYLRVTKPELKRGSETMTKQSVKDRVLEDDLKMTLLARIIPNLPVDDTRKWVKDIVKKFEFGHYFKEYGKLVREECGEEKLDLIYQLQDLAKEKGIIENKLRYCKKGNVSRIRKEVETFENPYPKDVFSWDNKEKLNFNRGRFNRHCFEVVENMRKKLLESLKKGEGG